MGRGEKNVVWFSREWERTVQLYVSMGGQGEDNVECAC